MNLGRVYDEPDGTKRVLVDRLWPRGFHKDDPRVDTWLPEVAPSTELRKWYGHQPERKAEFIERYRHELDTPQGAAALDDLRKLVSGGPATLVTATREVDSSHLPVLAELLGSGEKDA
ncbi:MAG: DUF488 family protein [Propionibacteriaceae bacterium]|nr:DUF488 family protein [Propionibacteriaceae bacterium]